MAHTTGHPSDIIKTYSTVATVLRDKWRMPTSATPVLDALRAQRIIALIRADSPSSLVECTRALSEGGLNCVELTMTTPGALEMAARVSRELTGVILGVGTVLHGATAAEAIAAGARFIVTPAVRPEVVAVCRQRGVPVFCGALTPTEVYSAWELGADVVKIFPAEFFGPSYIRSLRGPFPNIELMPTGGVTPENIGEFLRAGAFAAAAGSTLVTAAALRSSDWGAITARASEFLAAVKAAK